jgi:hypothetical protein
MNVKTNIYRDGTVWCHASWIDGEYDCSDPLGIDDSATELDAVERACALYPQAKSVQINRVDDIDTQAYGAKLPLGLTKY